MEQNEFILQENEPITMDTFQNVYDTLMGKDWVYKDRVFNLKKEGWQWGYSTKKTALGTCSYNSMRGVGKVTVSKTMLKLNLASNAKEFEDTIRHEIAHAIDYMMRDKSDHSIKWQKIAIALGAQPQRGKKVVNSVPKKWTGVCPNGHHFRRHKLTKAAKKGCCSQCCNELNGGFFSEKYKIDWKQNY